jgi:ribosomal protein S27AE
MIKFNQLKINGGRAMKFCPKCGMQNDDNAVVCTQCGYLFGNETIPQNAQPVYQQPPVYAQQAPVYGQPAIPKNNGFAIASLILGIVGVLACCYGLVPQVLAVVFGFIAKKKIKESNGAEQGENFAKIGTILGFVGFGIGLIVGIIVIVVFGPAMFSSFSSTTY